MKHGRSTQTDILGLVLSTVRGHLSTELCLSLMFINTLCIPHPCEHAVLTSGHNTLYNHRLTQCVWILSPLLQ